MGRVIETTVARACDPTVRQLATDGGVVTALLLHQLERGRIDGAIVTRPAGAFQRRPFLATTREEIKEGAGFFFDTAHGLKGYSDQYQTYSTIEQFDPVLKRGLRRVALVGTPCQIKSVRRMQTLGLVPSESIALCLGLFCSGNFIFEERHRSQLAGIGGFAWDEVRKLNIKEMLQVHLNSGERKTIPLESLDFMRRHACRYCPDYSAEFADLSFGGLGAEEGWTTVISRTPLGRAVLADARGAGAVEEFRHDSRPGFASQALEKVRTWSIRKRKLGRQKRRDLTGKPVQLKA
jgi:coenzyme F420 hydrogenase subunit beta